jgi:hypothetical protein
MSRVDDFHDAVRKHGGEQQALDRLIPGGTTTTPWQPAGWLKRELTQPELGARQEAVAKVLKAPPELVDVDPRRLRSSQPAVTRDGVSHYLNSRQWEMTGATYADQHNVGNQYPTVYRRSRDSEQVLLSGHHRATAALMRGEPLRARMVEGP